MTDARRRIPSVDRLLASPPFAELLAAHPRMLVVEAVQAVQRELRTTLFGTAAAGDAIDEPAWYAAATRSALERVTRRSLRPVINATGVVLHTNLGRAPLAAAAIDAMTAAARGYTNLEYDLERGARGSRYDHCTRLLIRLSGAEAALVVNNNAAALVLALNTLGRERDGVISRGELVEIGGSFRIPDIMARAGTRMVEVGSTNRTHLEDYARAIGDQTALILKVHPSNFRVRGFTTDVGVAQLAEIARPRGIPIVHDLGSGLLVEAASLGLPYEPTPRAALDAGADVVTMSGDKLLGGPQAGIILGRAAAIERMRRNPLCRALRVDKLTLAALEATLALYLDPERALLEVPVLRMLTCAPDALRARAAAVCGELARRSVVGTIERGGSAVGGGAFPEVELPTWLIRIAAPELAAAERALRDRDPAVIARIIDERLAVDLRTVDPAEEPALVDALAAVLGP